MQITELPEWLLSIRILGREEDDDQDDQDKDDPDADDTGDEEDNSGDEDGSDDEDDEEDDDLKKKVDALEESLRKERQLRRKAEREAKRKSRQRDKKNEDRDLDQTKEALQAAETRTQKLAEGLKKSRVEAAILEEARQQGFIDPTDALIDSVRDDVDVDQDEEDPSDIDIDFDSVKDAVGDLARRKKHLIGQPGEGGKSGSKFRKKSGSDSGKISEATLREQYPSLQ